MIYNIQAGFNQLQGSVSNLSCYLKPTVKCENTVQQEVCKQEKQRSDALYGAECKQMLGVHRKLWWSKVHVRHNRRHFNKQEKYTTYHARTILWFKMDAP